MDLHCIAYPRQDLISHDQPPGLICPWLRMDAREAGASIAPVVSCCWNLTPRGEEST